VTEAPGEVNVLDDQHTAWREHGDKAREQARRIVDVREQKPRVRDVVGPIVDGGGVTHAELEVLNRIRFDIGASELDDRGIEVNAHNPTARTHKLRQLARYVSPAAANVKASMPWRDPGDREQCSRHRVHR